MSNSESEFDDEEKDGSEKFSEEDEDLSEEDEDLSEEDFSNYYFSGNDFYKPDEMDPPIVSAAQSGNFASVKRIVEGKAMSSKEINKSRRWTEVQEKWGYDKSWEWHGDTALIAAARRGE